MRLFVGIPLAPGVASELARLAAELRRRVESRAARAKLTWVSPERLHVTVRFIGEVTAERADGVSKALEPPIAVPVFSLAVAGLGAFPGSGKPRTFWAGVSADGDAIAAVSARSPRAWRARVFLPRIARFARTSRLRASVTRPACAPGTSWRGCRRRRPERCGLTRLHCLRAGCRQRARPTWRCSRRPWKARSGVPPA